MFYGDIPKELSYLSSLQILDLAENSLSGAIPEDFGNCSAMKLTNDTRHSILGEFHGQVTINLGNYSHISFTDNLMVVTKGRVLQYGKILQFVTSIDLSSNLISGEIPEQFSNLGGLQNLNLSGNHLIGRIPDSVGGLKLPESLDLSRNELGGRISPSISFLTSLSDLNLSYNNLSGRIPSGDQLQTLDGTSMFAAVTTAKYSSEISTEDEVDQWMIW